MKVKYIIRRIWFLTAALVLAAGCVDEMEDMPDGRYGLVQFKLVKAFEEAEGQSVSTKADDGNRLEYLADACKITLNIRANDGSVVTPTLSVEASVGGDPEWGMWSEEYQLPVGDYVVIGFDVLDKLDGNILSMSNVNGEFTVTKGLTVKELGANTVARGYVKFEFVKSLPQLPETKASGSGYRLENIKYADFRIQNQATNKETSLKTVKAKVEYFYTSDDKDAQTASKIVCDTLLNIEAGNYKVTEYIVYSDKGKTPLEAGDVTTGRLDKDYTFEVKDNETAVAKVPVTLTVADAQIKDGIALKRFWEEMDGPNWSYRGIFYSKGCNWDFDRDIDLWVAQPGVVIDAEGRVISLNISSFGAKSTREDGLLSDALYELSGLKNLTLGNHDEVLTGGIVDQSTDEVRRIMDASFASETPWMRIPEEMHGIVPEHRRAEAKRIPSAARTANASVPGSDVYLVNFKGFPDGIERLTNLTRLFIARTPIETLPAGLAQLEKLTDVEVAYCNKLDSYEDVAVLGQLKALQMLYFVGNKGLDDTGKGGDGPLHRMLAAMGTNTAGNKDGGDGNHVINGIYFMDNNLEVFPAEMAKTTRLSFLNFSNNRIKEIEAAFGKSHNISTFNMSGNLLSDLPREESTGYFAGVESVEGWSFANNKFTVMPDIFDSEEPFYMGTLDFSGNEISGFEKRDGRYHGVNTEILDLSYNKLKEFPVEVLNREQGNSKLSFFQLRGNEMKTVSAEAFDGDYARYITSIDVAYNRISEWPRGVFSVHKMPMINGLDFSNNAFAAFPRDIANLPYLEVFLFRGQTNDAGYPCMREWPDGLFGHPSLKALYIGNNDIGKVTDHNLGKIRYSFEISGNYNISIDLSPLADKIRRGEVGVMFDRGIQDVRGVDFLF